MFYKLSFLNVRKKNIDDLSTDLSTDLLKFTKTRWFLVLSKWKIDDLGARIQQRTM